MVTFEDFEKVGLRVGTIVQIEEFPKARKPSYRLWIDLGELGIKRSSAQITALYKKEELLGKQVMCVTSFKPKQIANFVSEVLTTGFLDEQGSVVLAIPERKVANGSQLM